MLVGGGGTMLVSGRQNHVSWWRGNITMQNQCYEMAPNHSYLRRSVQEAVRKLVQVFRSHVVAEAGVQEEGHRVWGCCQASF